MKKIVFLAVIMTAMLSTSLSLTGWAADTSPAPAKGDSMLRAVPAAEKKAGPSTSNYDTQESPLSPSTIEGTEMVRPEQAETPSIGMEYAVKSTPTVGPKGIETLSPHTVIDIHDDIQSALDKLPANGILEIKGQGVLASDTLRIPEGVTINISENVSLVLGDLTAGDLPAGVGSSMTSASTAVITEGGTISMTVSSLKRDILQLQTDLKAAKDPQERREKQAALKKAQKNVRESQQRNRQAIHKIIAEAVHTKSKKK